MQQYLGILVYMQDYLHASILNNYSGHNRIINVNDVEYGTSLEEKFLLLLIFYYHYR